MPAGRLPLLFVAAAAVQHVVRAGTFPPRPSATFRQLSDHQPETISIRELSSTVDALESVPEPEPESEPEPEPEGEAEPEAEGEPELETDSDAEPEPEYTSDCFEVQSLAHGVANALLFIALLLAILRLFQVKAMTRLVGILVITTGITTGCRALFFLIDPYHTKQRLPELLAEYLIGLPLPAQNTADVLALIIDVQRIFESRRARRTPGGTKVLQRSSSNAVLQLRFGQFHVTLQVVRVWQFAYVMCALEFGVQIFADTMRFVGYEWGILIVCQVFFITWGLIIALGFLSWRVVARVLRPMRTGSKRPVTSAVEEPTSNIDQNGVEHVAYSVWLSMACTAVQTITALWQLSRSNLTSEGLCAFKWVEHSVACVNAGAIIVYTFSHRDNFVRARARRRSRDVMQEFRRGRASAADSDGQTDPDRARRADSERTEAKGGGGGARLVVNCSSVDINLR